MASWKGPRKQGPPKGPQVYSPFGKVPDADSRVTKTENLILASTDAAFVSMSLREVFPMRPSYGKLGKNLTLRANYFNLEPSLKLVLYRYDWKVKVPKKDEKQEDKKETGGELEGKKLGRVIQLCLESPDLSEFQRDIVTDFRAVLIARREIPDQEITVTYCAEGEDEPRQRAAKYTMTLKKNKTLHAADLISYLTSTDLNAQYGGQADAIQALNILINHHAKMSPKIATLGTSRSFALVDPEASDLGAGLRAMRGFFTSVRAATARMLLNVNVSHAVFYNAVPLESLMRSFIGSNGNNRYKLASFLKRLRIDATHIEKKNRKGEKIPRVKTIYGLATKGDGSNQKGEKCLDNPPVVNGYGAGAKDVEFWLNGPGGRKPSSTPQKKTGKAMSAGGRYISVYDYFWTTYRIRIQDPSLPIINVGTLENPSYMPAQVCIVMPGQRANHHLSAPQTTSMINFAVRGPADNAHSIVSKGLSTAGISDNTSSQLFGVTILRELITVEGRMLREPQVVYGSRQAKMNSGGWNMVPRDGEPMKFAGAGTIHRDWSMLFINMPDAYDRAKYFTENEAIALGKKLETILRQTGIAMRGKRLGPKYLTIRAGENEVAQLNTVLRAAAGKLDLLFVVLPATQMPLYNRLKQLADVDYGIHTICSVGSKIATERGQDQYLRNEILKVNLKFGGQNHHVRSDGLELINEDKTMIVGMDVTHPSPGSSSSAPSISGMVASIDSKLSQWPGTLRIQDMKREEMVSGLKLMLKSRLQLWKSLRNSKTYPENILVYRDGVSEGQYATVLQQELPQLREACKELYPPKDQARDIPRMTLIIVGKRHHTRFYATKEADADNSGNPKAGTVVDRGVTEARTWDFFLQSHSAIKGTARPAHYVVLLDEIFRHRYSKRPGKNIADELQMTTQSLCYTFGRATKAVSYCTPAYLADILCEREWESYGPERAETPDLDGSETSDLDGSETPNLDRSKKSLENSNLEGPEDSDLKGSGNSDLKGPGNSDPKGPGSSDPKGPGSSDLREFERNNDSRKSEE
ncbi:ribonuclease H-like domain-containing protein [Xylaria longipes]|nr:ribonuclease H-like domain-containing protein [Xylaria longipes]